jgi:polysaccharide deacetylase family sporulation protein PdaB
MKAYSLNLTKWKSLLFMGTAVVIAGLFFTSALYRGPLTKPVLGEAAQPVYKIKTNKKVAALTFNVNWGTRVTNSVLETLKTQEVKATFFVSGSWAKKYPELARRLVDECHEVASYGNRQINLSAEGRAVIREEIDRSRQQIKEATGTVPSLLRPPYGDWSEAVVDIAAAEGCTLIQWSVDSLDIQTPGVSPIVNNVVKKIHPGAIVMMSASDTASQTPEALPKVIEGLKAEGYRLVTVQELLKTGPAVVD